MKRFPWTFLFLFLLSFDVFADPWKDLARGDKTANEFLNNLDKKKVEGGAHPFYDGKKPPESKLNDTHIEGKAKTVSKSDPAGQWVYESQNARSQFKIDPQTDPLLTRSEKIMKTPLTEIGGEGTHMVETTQGGKDEVLNCEEAGDNSLEQCISNLSVKVIWKKVLKEKPASINLSGCKKSYKADHPRACQSIFNSVLSWRRWRMWSQTSGPINITDSFKACLQETLNHAKNQTSNRCWRCRNPRNIVPTDIKADKIKKVLIEK